MQHTLAGISGFMLMIASACSNPQSDAQRLTSNNWGSIKQVEDYHNPIVFEISMGEASFSVKEKIYSRREIESFLSQLSDLRPKPVLIVTKSEQVSRQDFEEFKRSVDDIFGCTSVLCLAER